MAEEVPETADGAARAYLFAIGFTLVLIGGEMMAEKDGGRFWPGLILVILALPVHLGWVFWKIIKGKISPQLRRSLNEIATDARWWVATLLVLLCGFVVFPFFDLKSSILAGLDWRDLAIGAFIGALIIVISRSRSKPAATLPVAAATSDSAITERNESARDLLLLLDFGITQTTVAMLDGLLRMAPDMPAYEGAFRVRDDFALTHEASVDFVRQIGIRLDRGSRRHQMFLSVMMSAEGNAEREVEQTPPEQRPSGVDHLTLRKYAIAYLKCVTAIAFLRSQKREAEEKLVSQRHGLIERMSLRNPA